MAEALAFPAPARAAWLERPGPSGSGIRLRAATADDLSFLRDLYSGSRVAELAHVPWPEAARRAFCDSQFLLQHRHYVSHFVPAMFLVVLLESRPVGRLYLHWTADDLRIIDILLEPAMQGRGVGSHLLRWTQAAARVAGIATVSLHVERRNAAAHRLYRRLGFREEDSALAGHWRMAWRAPLPGAPVS